MDESTPPPGVPPEDWAATPASVRALLLTLLDHLRNLEAQIRQHSGNSSKPPSSDPPSATPRSTKPQRRRPRGAQPGHVGQILDPEFQYKLTGMITAVLFLVGCAASATTIA